MRRALAVVAALAVLSTVRAVNYCGAKMCGHSNAHTFCRYPPGPSASCTGYMDGQLSKDEKIRIVSRLNRRRSEAASGRLRQLGTAGNMLKLRWVEELAREAQRWADQCRPPSTPDERDACRDLYSTTVGQCVASVVGEAPGLRVESMVDLWYMQNINYKGNTSYYQVPMSNISYYGDFAQIVWARSYMVGCGRSRFMSDVNGRMRSVARLVCNLAPCATLCARPGTGCHLQLPLDVNGRMRSVERLVCNLAPRGPPPARPLWAPAAPTSVCPPRSVPDPELAAMCNYQRDLDASTDVDGAMTIEEHILLSLVLELEDKPILNHPGSLDELYMTKLAVVTMENRITTQSYYKPAHKRDIIDTLGLAGDVVHIDNVLVENDVNQFINATRIIVKIGMSTEVEESVTKKANLIGRPKSYNIEDLNDVTGDNSFLEDINHHDDLPRRDIHKFDPDLYLEYSSLDDEYNVSSKIEAGITLNVTSSIEQANISSMMTSLDFLASLPSTDLHKSSQTESTHVISYSDQVIERNMSDQVVDGLANITMSMNASTTTSVTKSDDDYLTDPETVRELQEALERMEKNLEENRPSGKVRRELRNLQEMLPDTPDITKEDVPMFDEGRRTYKPVNYQNEPALSALAHKNMTDRNPMLGMVLKYMPYLKPYEKEILGTTTSSGFTFDTSYVLLSFGFVLTCF